MRLIDADAIQIPKTHADAFENCRNCELLDADQVREIIDNAPTVEPKRGEWIECDVNDTSGYWKCSACGESTAAIVARTFYNFCPFCGAKMGQMNL